MSKPRFSAAFRVDGVPKAQPRVKAWARKMGDKHVARVYTPGTAEEWKALIAQAAAPHRPSKPIEGPVRMAINYQMPRPKRLCRKKDPTGELWCPVKPDEDNLNKALKDCLTQAGWWRDDAQVCSTLTTKRYHAIDARPGVSVVISEMPSD